MAFCRANGAGLLKLCRANSQAVLDILRNNQRNPVLRYQLNQKEEKFILNQKNSKKVFKVKVDVDKSKEQIKSAVGDLVNAPSLYLSDRKWLMGSCFKLKNLGLQERQLQSQVLSGALSSPELDALLKNKSFYTFCKKGNNKLPAFIRNIKRHYIARYSQAKADLIFETQEFKESVFNMNKEDREDAMHAMVYQLVRSEEENKFEIAASFLEAEFAKKHRHPKAWREVLMRNPDHPLLERVKQDGTLSPFEIQLAKALNPNEGNFSIPEFIDLLARQNISNVLGGIRCLLESSLTDNLKKKTVETIIEAVPIIKSEIKKDSIILRQIVPYLGVDMLLFMEPAFRKTSGDSHLLKKMALADAHSVYIPMDEVPDYFLHWLSTNSIQDLVNYCEMSSENHLRNILKQNQDPLTKEKVIEMSENVDLLMPILNEKNLLLDFAVYLGNVIPAEKLNKIFENHQINRNYFDLVASGMNNKVATSFSLESKGSLRSSDLFASRYLGNLSDANRDKFEEEIIRRVQRELKELNRLGSYRFNSSSANTLNAILNMKHSNTEFHTKLITEIDIPAPVLKFLNDKNSRFNEIKQTLDMDLAQKLTPLPFGASLDRLRNEPKLENLRDLLVLYNRETFLEVRNKTVEIFGLGKKCVDNLERNWQTIEIAGAVTDARPLLPSEFVFRYVAYVADNHQDEFTGLLGAVVRPKDYQHVSTLENDTTEVIFHYLRNFAKTNDWKDINSAITSFSRRMKLDLRSEKTKMAEVATEWASQDQDKFLERALKIQQEEKIKIIDGKISNLFINDDLFRLQVTKEVRDRGLERNAAKLLTIFNLVKNGNHIAARELISANPLEKLDEKYLDNLLIEHAEKYPVISSGVEFYNELLKALEPGMSSVDAQTMLTTVFFRLIQINIPANRMLDFAENLDEFSLLPAEQGALRNFFLQKQFISYKTDPAMAKFTDAVNDGDIGKAIQLGRKEAQESTSFVRSKYIIQRLSSMILKSRNSNHLDSLLDILDLMPQYKLPWHESLSIVSRLLEEKNIDRAELILRTLQLPPIENKMHQAFIEKITVLLRLFSDENPVKSLPNLRNLLQLVATGQHGIPPSFVPEISDRVLIGSWEQHNHSIQKLLYVLENEIHGQNLKSKIDLFADYLVKNKTYNAAGALQTIAKSKFSLERQRPELDASLKALNVGFCLGIMNYSDNKSSLTNYDDILISVKISAMSCRLFIFNYLVSSLTAHALSPNTDDLSQLQATIQSLNRSLPQPADSLFVAPIFVQKFKTLLTHISPDKQPEVISLLRSSGLMTDYLV